MADVGLKKKSKPGSLRKELGMTYGGLAPSIFTHERPAGI